jgi:hypothetical protein
MSRWSFDPGADCWCCPDPATYLWTSAKSGYGIRLCAACCANWRAKAKREPGFAPSRIQLLANAK